MEVWEVALSIAGTTVGVAALLLYIWDRIRIEPVIVRVLVRKMDEPDIYLIQADLSNEGGRKASGCTAAIEINSNLVEQLAYVPVDSPIGRIGVDWPQQPRFTMYPRRTMPVRGYLKAPKDTHVSIVLRKDDKEKHRYSFKLP